MVIRGLGVALESHKGSDTVIWNAYKWYKICRNQQLRFGVLAKCILSVSRTMFCSDQSVPRVYNHVYTEVLGAKGYQLWECIFGHLIVRIHCRLHPSWVGFVTKVFQGFGSDVKWILMPM